IVDGRIGFTGGVGISDDWMGNARGPGEWRDTHYRLEGPAVAQMQAAFLDNWMETQNEVLDGADHFPKLDPVGDTKAQVFKASPDEASESLRLMYLMALSAARRSIRIMASYFVPDRLTAATLIAARRRGVSVEVIVPGRQIDVRMVRWTSRSLWGPLLEAGVVIHEFQPSMYHCKVMVVDGLWVSVGSGNFDNRSFALNDEANLNIYDARIAALETAAFEADRDRSRPITLREWSSRPLPERAVGWAGRLVKSQL
ncbi:MAG TPA: phospholipase D-like domain-containing protein, partial [Alphaproteobacteria bacterium]|nr:phospholipase D-like domain-containing protein [Alphaproteobacteria bacterium]